MIYINDTKLNDALNDYCLINSVLINGFLDDIYDIINDIISNYNIFNNNTEFDFTPYFVNNGTNYIYIMGRRIKDNMEFIIDDDFFIEDNEITKEILYNKIVELDKTLQNKIKEYNLNN